VAGNVCVYVTTNPFKADEPPYQRSTVVSLAKPTDDTLRLVAAARLGVDSIFRRGYRYKKAGVLLTGLERKALQHASLFDDVEADGKSARLMHAIDTINVRMGKDAVGSAAAGIDKPWQMRRERKSPGYTTGWDELALAT
jgi:DNA polymerase V